MQFMYICIKAFHFWCTFGYRLMEFVERPCSSCAVTWIPISMTRVYMANIINYNIVHRYTHSTTAPMQRTIPLCTESVREAFVRVILYIIQLLHIFHITHSTRLINKVVLYNCCCWFFSRPYFVYYYQMYALCDRLNL